MHDETNPTIPATLRHDPVSHFHWLELEQRASDEVIAELKAAGWRWSSYRQQWRTNRRYYSIPASISATDAGACDYASERADRLEQRADCHRERSTAAYERSNRYVEHIPLGQPILIGHHSERGHRAALKRSRQAMDLSVREGAEAKRLAADAKSSRSHQARKQTPEAMQRRVDRLSAEERQLTKIIAGLKRREQAGENVATYRQQCDWRLGVVREEIGELTQAIQAAGGIMADKLAAAGIVAEPGDLVQIQGFTGRIVRVNPKTYTVNVGRDLGRDEWILKLDRTRLQRVIAKAADLKYAEQRAEQRAEAQEQK